MSEKKRPENWPAEQKLKTVQEYDALPDEEAQGRLLRKRGLHSGDIERWREEMLQALGRKPNRKDPKNQRIKELESELRRKEKALAETAALLTLKKKPPRSGGTARTTGELGGPTDGGATGCRGGHQRSTSSSGVPSLRNHVEDTPALGDRGRQRGSAARAALRAGEYPLRRRA